MLSFLRTHVMIPLVLCLMLVSVPVLVATQDPPDIGTAPEAPRLELRRIPEDGSEEYGTLIEEYTVLIEDDNEYRHGHYRRWSKDPYILVDDLWYYRGKLHGPQLTAPKEYHIEDNDNPPRRQYRREFACLDGRLHGTDRSYYANDRVSDAKEYRFGELLWSKAWWPDGTQQFSSEVEGEGYRRTWYPSGQLMLESQHKDGRNVGRSRYWYANGQIKTEQHYEEGLLQGPYTEWYESGQKSWEGAYHRHEKTGVWKHWDEEGKLIRTEDHGKPKDSDD